jgi:ABC-type phosphate/phosphonate transport system substrate-binding protein
MDKLAAAVSTAAGWPPARLAAEYHETEEGGVARLKAKTPALAMIPLPFYLVHQSELKLTARAQAVEKDGTPATTWTLVAKKGRVTSAESLAGFTIVSLAAYAPDFIRNVALAKWGSLPANVKFQATGQVLGALRKSANGDDVAVLLDASQAASLPTLPFAADLAVVATSPPLPAFLVCTVGSSVGPSDTKKLTGALLKLHETPEGTSTLDAVRLSKFVPLDAKGLTAARESYTPPAKPKTR